jgi:beta-galactosidase/beta-glucuronidase
MEAAHPAGLKRAQIIPELDQSRFVIYPEYYALERGEKLKVEVKDGSKTVASATIPAATPSIAVLPIKGVKTWSPESPFLYDINLEVIDEQGKTIDKVASYAGMRKVHVEGNRLFLNNRPYYLRLVLDQGFYPTGVWTAPTDNDLRRDIELSMQAGFNGARLHQKVFEERFHYWADRLGYLTWGESSSWGMDMEKPEAARNFISEWESIVLRDRNHPSIIAWTPFNETGKPNAYLAHTVQHDRFLRDLYALSHALDYRPVNDASGYTHARTDLWTVHNYDQNPVTLKETLSLKDGKAWQNIPDREIAYAGQPYFVDEYGGIKWITGKQFAENSWGYGEGPRSVDEFMSRLAGLTDAILGVEHISGYCYTQLTDVEQEQNGIYNYDRTPKFDMDKVRAILSKNPENETYKYMNKK